MSETSINMTTFTDKFMENLEQKIIMTKLRRKISKIENYLSDPCIITIEGYEYLQSVPGEHWTNRVKNLWKEASLPSFYILDMYCENTSKIFVELVSLPIKLFVLARLNHFVRCQQKDRLIFIK